MDDKKFAKKVEEQKKRREPAISVDANKKELVESIRQCWKSMGKKEYPKGIRISNQDNNKIRIKKDRFLENWNYTILPSLENN